MRFRKQEAVAVAIAGTVTSALSGGFILGSMSTHRFWRKNMNNRLPVVEALVRDILIKAREENMTTDEFQKYVDEQMKFFRLVIN
jgi:hypothetical protein